MAWIIWDMLIPDIFFPVPLSLHGVVLMGFLPAANDRFLYFSPLVNLLAFIIVAVVLGDENAHYLPSIDVKCVILPTERI